MSTIDKYFNCNSYFINNIDIFIDSFVDYYGEDNRKDIEDRFRKCLFFLYLKPSSLDEVIYYIKKECAYSICRELTNGTDNIRHGNLTFYIRDFMNWDNSVFGNLHRFYRDEAIPTIDKINKVINSDSNDALKLFPYLDKESFIDGIKRNSIPNEVINMGIDDAFKFNELLNDTYSSLNSFNSIVNILCIVNCRLFDDNYYEFLDDINMHNMYEFTSRLDELYEKYCDNTKELDDYSKYSYRYNKYSSRLYSKSFNEFVDSNYFIVDEMLDKAIKLGLNTSYDSDTISNIKDFIFGSDFLIPSQLSSIIVTEDNLLHNDYRKKRTIKLLRLLGATGSDKSILSNPLYLSLIPSDEIIETLEEDKFLKYKEVSKKLLINFLDNKKIYDKFSSMNFTTDYIDSIFNSNVCGFMSNGLTSDTNKFYPLIILNMGHYLNGLSDDHFLVHELNHLYEGFTSMSSNGNDYLYGSGWDLTSTDYSDRDNPYGKDNSSYTEINEVINELISKEISSKMHSNGRYLFSNPTYHFDDSSGYDCMIPMVYDFYNTYKSDIIKSRKAGRIDIIFNTVGRDNFDELSNLCRDFYISNIRKDNGEISVDQFYESYLEFDNRKDNILSNMREYNSLKERSI